MRRRRRSVPLALAAGVLASSFAATPAMGDAVPATQAEGTFDFIPTRNFHEDIRIIYAAVVLTGLGDLTRAPAAGGPVDRRIVPGMPDVEGAETDLVVALQRDVFEPQSACVGF